MKKITVFLLCACLACAMTGCGEAEYLRIHIRAHSNSVLDQSVKLVVRDAVVEYLTPFLQDKSSLSQAIATVKQRLDTVSQVALRTLQEQGFSYGVTVRLDREFFPTRTYGSIALASGVYDALIIELGAGQGDNWWCIAYPPLCFGGAGEVEVKSWIWERWKQLFGD